MWSVDSRDNYYNCCHQMLDFKAKVHQIRFRLAAARFYGPTFKGRGKGKEREEEGREKGEGRDHHRLQPPRSKFSGYVGL